MKHKKLFTLSLGLFLVIFIGSIAYAKHKPVIHVYGPGGPYPPMHEIAQLFSKKFNVRVIVTRGPSKKWMRKAWRNGDIIYSGAEFMMQHFVWAMKRRIDIKTIKSLYLRPSGILVRKGNPKHIRGFRDLLKPYTKILVVDGAGQTGLWEDMAGKQGDIRIVMAFRKNIVFHAKNSAEAKKMWLKVKTIDAWLIWNIWQISNKDIADFVPVSKEFVIYRDCGIAMTFNGEKKAIVRKFYNFVQSKEAAKIFKKWGWITE